MTHTFKYSATAMLALAGMATALARPAYPGLLYATLEDGTRIGYHLVGDEYAHACITLDGRYIERVSDLGTPTDAAHHPDGEKAVWRFVEAPVAAEAAEQAPLRRAPQSTRYTSFPTLGEVRGLVLLVDYQDVHFQPEHDQALYQRQLNEEGYSDYQATGSARDYFIAQSGGLFCPKFDVVGPVKLNHPMSYYGTNQAGQDARPGQMIVDACRYAHDSLSIDFSQYDYDDDGNVDFVFCLYAGYGENYGASSNTIWPHMSRLSSQWQNLKLDGKTVDLYACSCELNGTTGTQIDGIGAVCHEFGHVLGLPDIYNTSMSAYTQLGQWDVMDAGSYNNNSRTPCSYTSFERHQLGWLDYIDLTQPLDSVVVPEINASHTAYRIFTAEDPDEFFTLENHQKQGWDAAQGGRGLMIIHVTYDASIWRANAVNSSLFPHYDLIEADGTPGRSYETDLYPIDGLDMFTDYSTPNSLSWMGVPTDAGVTHIVQHDDGNISFAFMNDRLHRPEALPATAVTDTSFVAQWTAVDGAIGYNVHLTEQLPDSLNPLVLEEDFALMADDEPGVNIAYEVNDYTHQPGWKATQAYSSAGMVRLGALGVSGELITPRLTTTQPEVTVSLTCCAYKGKSVNYDVTLLDANEHVLRKQTFKATRDMQTPVVVFEQCPEVFRVSVASSKERLFIDAMRIAQGQIDSLTLWNVGPREWDEYCEADAEQAGSIVSLTVSPLLPGRTYSYHVVAADAESLRNSAPSDEVTVTLPQECGIGRVEADSVACGVIVDLQGRTVGKQAGTLKRGLYIEGGRKVMVL